METTQRIDNNRPDLPDISNIYSLAYAVIDNLPEKFQAMLKNLIVRIENFADEKTLDSLHIADKYDLLGLYRGIPLPLKNFSDSMVMPDIIFLYRGPLIRFSRENNESLGKLVYHVMIHEIGHHFGYSDQDMQWLEGLDEATETPPA